MPIVAAPLLIPPAKVAAVKTAAVVGAAAVRVGSAAVRLYKGLTSPSVKAAAKITVGLEVSRRPDRVARNVENVVKKGLDNWDRIEKTIKHMSNGGMSKGSNRAGRGNNSARGGRGTMGKTKPLLGRPNGVKLRRTG